MKRGWPRKRIVSSTRRLSSTPTHETAAQRDPEEASLVAMGKGRGKGRGKVGRVALGVAGVAMVLSSCASGRPGTAMLGVMTAKVEAAPQWVSGARMTPHRPVTCPALRVDPNTPTPGQHGSLTGTFPWPAPSSANHTSLTNDHNANVFPPVRPSNWLSAGGNWKLTSARSTNPSISSNPQELCGVMGGSVDKAWQTTTGSPTTVIAITDSGIEWCDPSIVDKIYLNEGALPPPENAQGKTRSEVGGGSSHGGSSGATNPYDLNGSGVFNVAQYASDPRVMKVAKTYGGLFCSTKRGPYPPEPGLVSPMDLIRAFGTRTLPGGGANPYYYGHESPAGFTEAIAGWNFINNNNDAYDAVHYDHGTGEAQDAAGAANTLTKEVGACPNCMVLPIRVGDSFIASSNAFAQGVLFAVDSGASVIQEALGTYDITETARQAISYAESHGVPVVASAADEEAQHHNLPALLAHTIVVNSVTKATSYNPPSYLYLNGCTNYGANVAVSVESSSCSSEATGKTGGVVGLAESAARAAMANGVIRPYPGLHSANGGSVPLSVNEIRQLVTMSASPVDFAKAAPPNGPANNYAVSAPGVPLVKTTRYPSQAGYNMYFGYGRLDAARLVSWIQRGDIPPVAQINSPSWFGLFAPDETMTVTGVVGTPRAPSWRYQVDIGVGSQPKPGSWKMVAQGSGTGVKTGVLATLPMNDVRALFPRGTSFSGGPVTSSGSPAANRFTFSLRVVVQVTAGKTKGMVGVARRAEFVHSDGTLLSGYPKKFASSLDAPPTLAPIGPSHTNVLLVPTAGGSIYAIESSGKELPGFPVHTANLAYHSGEAAFKTGAVSAVPRGEIIGGVAVGDLSNANGSNLDVVACDLAGYCYAWNTRGQLLAGYPVRTNPAFSSPAAVSLHNRLLPGIMGAPALADLSGNNTLDVVAASMDRHVYAWGPTGHPVPGWPVLVVDPTQVKSVDPVTNKVTFKSSVTPDQGTKLVATPAIGNLNGGSGPPDVVVGSNETYKEPLNASVGSGPLSLFLNASGLSSSAGNSRVYAIYPNGSLHGASAQQPRPPGYPNPGAFLPGWPVAIADLSPGLLPTVADGITASPALADLAGNGKLETALSSSAGPGYVLNPNGSSFLGTAADGKPKVTASSGAGPLSNSTGLLGTSIPALGGAVLAPLGGSSPGISMIEPALSVGKLLDQGYAADQTPHDSQVDAWNTSTGSFDPGFPQLLNDMAFLSSPIVADVGGARNGPYAVVGSATYDIRALNANGKEAPGFPKFTGGWLVNSPTFAPFGSVSTQVLAAGTREGYLFLWRTPTPACSSSGPWPRQHHDLWNTGNLNAVSALKPSVPASCRHR
ncbi:MAG: S8 family serine peptidase [Acidimicrobiales bacterium]